MKKILGILLLTSCLAWGDKPTYGSKDNPGLIDDPGCKTLIRNQLRDTKEDPKNFTITYFNTTLASNKDDPDGSAMNFYTITNKTTGQKIMAIVALHFGPVPSPSPSPSPHVSPSPLPSPTPSPANFIPTDHA